MKAALLLMALLFAPAVVAQELRVAVAANFLGTLQQLAPRYEQLSGDRLLISAGSSGKLYAQILHGAPFDVLLAADRSYPARLAAAGKVVAGSRFVYATGELVLWSADGERAVGEAALRRTKGRIALANPRTAPYGRAAQEVVTGLGLDGRLRLVQGESVAQAFQFTASGNVDYGFVALAQVVSRRNRGNRQHYWRIPQRLYSPLQQEAALLLHGEGNPAARRFLDFLASPAAQALIGANGYRLASGAGGGDGA